MRTPTIMPGIMPDSDAPLLLVELEAEGTPVGVSVGLRVAPGVNVGLPVGALVGDPVGVVVGLDVGLADVGLVVGFGVCPGSVGERLGLEVGVEDGALVNSHSLPPYFASQSHLQLGLLPDTVSARLLQSSLTVHKGGSWLSHWLPV